MKTMLFFLLSAISTTVFGQTGLLDSGVNGMLLKANSHQLSNDEIRKIRIYATNLQNQGFVLEERKQDYAGSLAKIDRSLSIWHQLRDTFCVANLLKYKGYLLGHFNRFPEAKIKIDSAIYLFKTIKYPQGVAVSELYLSRVYELEPRLDSALKYGSMTMPFWKMQKDTFRIITSGNQIINLYIKMKMFDQALELQRQLSPLLAQKNLHWQPVVDFYFLSIQVFKELDQKETERHYKLLFQEKVNSLRSEKIEPVVRYGQYAN